MTDARLVIDTNLWISRLLLPGSLSATAVDAALCWGTPLASTETMAELADVLARPKFDRYVSREDRSQFIHRMGGLVRLIPITQHVQICRDPKDDKFLDVALNGQAQLILTGDQDLLALHPFHGIDILKPADFLRRLEDAGQGSGAAAG